MMAWLLWMAGGMVLFALFWMVTSAQMKAALGEEEEEDPSYDGDIRPIDIPQWKVDLDKY